MKSLALKLAVLGAFLSLPFVIELFVLPIDYFTFRIWESVTAGGTARPASGSFYPNMHVVKEAEHGDQLGFKDPQPKHVEWYTDRHGFRNRPRQGERRRYDIVIVGSSNIVGSYYDQHDTLAEVMTVKCHCEVYSYSVSSVGRFFSDPRFIETPPRVVVMEAGPGHFYVRSLTHWFFDDKIEAPTAYLPTSLAILVDRFAKAVMLQYTRSRLGIQFVKEPDTDFLSNDEANKFAEEMFRKSNAEAKQRGMDLMWLIQATPDQKINPAIAKMADTDIKIISFPPNADFPNGVNLAEYWSEHDSHWQAQTIRDVADMMLAKLGWPNYAPESQPPRFLNRSPSRPTAR